MTTFMDLINEVKAKVAETDVVTVRKKLDEGTSCNLIDVREESERAEGYIPGSIHIGRGMLEPKIEKMIENRDSEIILYCGLGARSLLAAESLARMGYTNVSSMADGIGGWKKAGYPTESGK